MPSLATHVCCLKRFQLQKKLFSFLPEGPVCITAYTENNRKGKFEASLLLLCGYEHEDFLCRNYELERERERKIETSWKTRRQDAPDNLMITLISNKMHMYKEIDDCNITSSWWRNSIKIINEVSSTAMPAKNCICFCSIWSRWMMLITGFWFVLCLEYIAVFNFYSDR